jgi:hypothetical protein
LERAAAAAPADSVVTVRGATYPDTMIRFRGAPITYQAKAGEKVSVGRTEIRGSTGVRLIGMTFPSGVDILDASKNTVVKDSELKAVTLRHGVDGVLIEGNLIHNETGTTIIFNSVPTRAPISNVTIRGNRITRAAVDGMQLTNFRNVVVEDNEISNVWRTDPMAHPDAIQTVHGGSGLIIRRNYFHDNDAQQIFTKDGATSGVRIENNLIADNGQRDLTTPFAAVQLLESDSPVLVNNTIVNSGPTYMRAATTNAVVKNNILDKFQSFEGATVAYEDYNLIIGTGGRGANDLTGDPGFVDAAARDYRLAPGSPAIDTGSSAGAPPRDRLGHRRIDGPAVRNSGSGSSGYVDVGAYERQP